MLTYTIACTSVCVLTIYYLTQLTQAPQSNTNVNWRPFNQNCSSFSFIDRFLVFTLTRFHEATRSGSHFKQKLARPNKHSEQTCSRLHPTPTLQSFHQLQQRLWQGEWTLWCERSVGFKVCFCFAALSNYTLQFKSLCSYVGILEACITGCQVNKQTSIWDTSYSPPDAGLLKWGFFFFVKSWDLSIHSVLINHPWFSRIFLCLYASVLPP